VAWTKVRLLGMMMDNFPRLPHSTRAWSQQDVDLGAWMSAALDDSKVCDELKRDINAWIDQYVPLLITEPEVK